MSHRSMPGAQPSIMTGEWRRAAELVKTDARWQKAMRRRGYKDLETISCPPQSAGYFPQDGFGDRRIFKVSCYAAILSGTGASIRTGRGRSRASSLSSMWMPAAVVDVIDIEPVLQADAIENHGLGPMEIRDKPKPVAIVSPQGPNFTLKGAIEVGWNAWSFHLRGDRRAGLIVSLARFNDAGEERLVAYQMALNEMFVPYMDPHPGLELQVVSGRGRVWSGISDLVAGEGQGLSQARGLCDHGVPIRPRWNVQEGPGGLHF